MKLKEHILCSEHTVALLKASPGSGTFTGCFIVHTIYLQSKLENSERDFFQYFDDLFSLRNSKKNVKLLHMKSKIIFTYCVRTGFPRFCEIVINKGNLQRKKKNHRTKLMWHMLQVKHDYLHRIWPLWAWRRGTIRDFYHQTAN